MASESGTPIERDLDAARDEIESLRTHRDALAAALRPCARILELQSGHPTLVDQAIAALDGAKEGG